MAFEVFIPVTLVEGGDNRDRKSPSVIYIHVQSEVLKCVLRENKRAGEEMSWGRGRGPTGVCNDGWWWALPAQGGSRGAQEKQAIPSPSSVSPFPWEQLALPCSGLTFLLWNAPVLQSQNPAFLPWNAPFLQSQNPAFLPLNAPVLQTQNPAFVPWNVPVLQNPFLVLLLGKEGGQDREQGWATEQRENSESPKGFNWITTHSSLLQMAIYPWSHSRLTNASFADLHWWWFVWRCRISSFKYALIEQNYFWKHCICLDKGSLVFALCKVSWYQYK